MHDAIKNNYSLTLFSEEMTRFFIKVEDAIDIIKIGLDHSGAVIAPKLKSYNIKDSFELFSEKFGLKYSIGIPRPSEKIHELMISYEESPRVQEVNSLKEYFLIHQNISNERITLPNNEFSSKDVCISKQELKNFLEQNNYFQ
jgi:UDP-glucose 4-epimerase